MLFDLLSVPRKASKEGALAAIYVARQAGVAMTWVKAVEAHKERGLHGDRYFEGRGFWKHTDACQVTLIGEEDLFRIGEKTGLHVLDGEHRRNLVIRGLPLAFLEGRQFRIGGAVFKYEKRRPPCGYLESITQPGMARGLGRRSGICARILQGGTIRVGNAVVIV